MSFYPYCMEVTLCRDTVGFPRRATQSSIGLDLQSAVDITLLPFETERIPTGLKVKLPVGCYGRVAGRSGMSTINTMVTGGVIDPDYKGEIYVCMTFFGTGTIELKKGDRIAQLICEQAVSPYITMAVDPVRRVRGDEGFGSTGR